MKTTKTKKKATPARRTTKRPTASSRTTKRPSASSRKSAPKGLSLHLGLNSVDPAHYAGWTGDLFACEFDANDMSAIAESRGMSPSILLTRDATRKTVLGALRDAAKELKSGDFYFLSFSGHGGQVDDVTGEEDDKLDETWCLYDSQLIDDELYLELGKFPSGVRILVLSDSCHSGTVTRAPDPVPRPGDPRPKLMPRAIAMRTYQANKSYYDKVQRDVAKAAGKKRLVDPDLALSQVAVSPRLEAIAATFNPALILISGCLDNQTSLDGNRNGAFTEQLIRVWSKGDFKGNYGTFHAKIKAGMSDRQTPNLFPLGDAGAFLKQGPFEV
jgi:hypothetical protein